MKLGLRNRRTRRGQGMTEYIIIVAVIAILSMAVLYAFGDQIRELFWGAGTELSGQDATIEGQMGDKDEYTGNTISDL